MRADYRPRTFGNVNTGGGGLFLFLGLALIIAVFVNTSVGYLPSSVGGLSFTALTRRLFWVILLLSISISAALGYRTALVSVAVACSMVFFRVLTAISPSTVFLLTSYRLCYSMVIALAAAVLYSRAPGLYDKFLKVVIYLSVLVLLVQVLGVSEAVHSWNSLGTGIVGGVGGILSPTLLVESGDLTADYRQLRPPGLFYANSVSAVFVIFAIAFRLSQPIRRVTFYDLLLVYAVLLMMAKIAIVFLVFAMAVRYFVSRNRLEVRAMRYQLLAAGGLFLLHSVLFPGVFSTMLSTELLFTSAWFRLSDLLTSVGVDPSGVLSGLDIVTVPLLGLEVADLNAISQSEIAGRFSGIRVLVVLTPLLLWLWLRIRRVTEDAMTVEHVRRGGFLILALVFAFFASPLLGTPLIALLFGPALVPLLPPGVARTKAPEIPDSAFSAVDHDH